MKFAVLSDIHGNLPALEAVLENATLCKPDGILAAGDHINAGPFPRETLALLREAGCQMIRGNGDDYIVAFDRNHMPPEMKASLQWGAIRWAHTALLPEEIAFLADMPPHVVVRFDGILPIRMVHGSLAPTRASSQPAITPPGHGTRRLTSCRMRAKLSRPRRRSRRWTKPC